MTVTLSATDTTDLQELVRAVVWQVCGCDDDDLAQDAWVAILLLIPRYDPQLGVPLRGFVHARCRGLVVDALRVRAGAGNGRRKGGTLHPVPLDDWDAVSRDGNEVDDRDELVRAMRNLTPRQKAALWAEFVAEEDQLELAARFGCTQSRVSQIISEARRAGRSG